jgi:uncharacterized membrane protein YeaQ/YmgE (transglycosylase-associated protein family)
MVFSLNGTEFSIIEILVWLIVAAICGAIGELLVGYSPGGLVGSIAVGLIGALVGSWLARALDLPSFITFTYEGITIEVLWTIIGAALFVGILSLLRGGPRRYSRRYRRT